MSYLGRWYNVISVLSIDVVTGAIASAVFFGYIFGAQLHVPEMMALGLTVWIIYTADHLSDAKKIKHVASTTRHRFHQQHARPLKSFLALALLMDGMTVLFIDPEVIRWGVVLAFLVLIFLIIQQSIAWMKEVSIAVFYTIGVLLPSLSRTHFVFHPTHYLLVAQFFLAALVNLLLFSWFDRTSDRLDGLRSFVTIAGENKTRQIIVALSVLQLITCFLQFMLRDSNQGYFLIGAMGVILLLIFLFEKKYSDHALSRFLGEAVFILPILYLL